MQAGKAEWFGDRIRRVLAPNPSPMTGPGTNTYLIGSGSEVLVVDPGPAIPDHLQAIMGALQSGEQITKIVVTHAHADHSSLARGLQAQTGAEILAFGTAGEARSPIMRSLAEAGLTGGGEGVDLTFVPDRRITDGETISGPWGHVVALHCPGHMAEHLCLSCDGILFSGDHAMGWSTSLVSPPDGDMGAYMRSLERLMASDWHLMLPGHGKEVRPVAERLSELYRHRRMREQAIRDTLTQGPASPFQLAEQLYLDTPAALLPAATRNILAHLIDLADRNVVTCDSDIGPDQLFRLHRCEA